MRRNEFIKLISVFGIGGTMPSLFLTGCNEKDDLIPEFEVSFNGKVLITGAGAAGLIAGHILNQYNIDFQILEASSVFGGRVKDIKNFADFPIDLGAEWIHTHPSILKKLLNTNPSKDFIDTIVYNPQTISVFKDNELKTRDLFSVFYSEYKFKDTTWYSYFDKYIVPNIKEKIIYNTPVKSINYSKDKVAVSSYSNNTFEADKVILTVPLTVLKDNDIDFNPALPPEKLEALNKVDMPDGIKVFIEFKERFYPDILGFDSVIKLIDQRKGAQIYYNAAFKKDTNKHILGLFTVGEQSSVYANMETDEALISYILDELDQVFDGKASKNYIKHITQNWSKEPYIRGSYSHYKNYSAMDILSKSVNDKIYFAGEAYHSKHQATVHGAGLSAYNVVEQILK